MESNQYLPHHGADLPLNYKTKFNSNNRQWLVATFVLLSDTAFLVLSVYIPPLAHQTAIFVVGFKKSFTLCIARYLNTKQNSGRVVLGRVVETLSLGWKPSVLATWLTEHMVAWGWIRTNVLQLMRLTRWPLLHSAISSRLKCRLLWHLKEVMYVVLHPWLEHGTSRFGGSSKIRTYNLYSLTTAGCQFSYVPISRALSSNWASGAKTRLIFLVV